MESFIKSDNRWVLEAKQKLKWLISPLKSPKIGLLNVKLAFETIKIHLSSKNPLTYLKAQFSWHSL